MIVARGTAGAACYVKGRCRGKKSKPVPFEVPVIERRNAHRDRKLTKKLQAMTVERGAGPPLARSAESYRRL